MIHLKVTTIIKFSHSSSPYLPLKVLFQDIREDGQVRQIIFYIPYEENVAKLLSKKAKEFTKMTFQNIELI